MQGSEIIKSGTVRGRISGNSVMGGVVGSYNIFSTFQIDQVYSKRDVLISCSAADCGGIIG